MHVYTCIARTCAQLTFLELLWYTIVRMQFHSCVRILKRKVHMSMCIWGLGFFFLFGALLRVFVGYRAYRLESRPEI